MKIRIIIGCLAFLLIASIAGNIYLYENRISSIQDPEFINEDMSKLCDLIGSNRSDTQNGVFSDASNSSADSRLFEFQEMQAKIAAETDPDKQEQLVKIMEEKFVTKEQPGENVQ
ncbi:MAG: hypothetical protein ACD_56C00078G0003 [uncultured bacterium]|nr:MAG: hypothetical protein ACD_56C00078G0003 [uncultured bacterium]